MNEFVIPPEAKREIDYRFGVLEDRIKSLERENSDLKKENDVLKITVQTIKNEEVKQRVIDYIRGI